ncbi:hypothetical protein psyc5s11_29230 [Clostridium gelidum]|uniref:Helicase ATP-binding domain-containing protein n=1 Tax=Clostridium gelidum TaxID=704125 RepID=A0ABM7T696_9CLOT|nr:DEAD/DEAH box helicase family protein [Clostridium gelidum]BCZ46856.1 hypothetical protein psyc5s11_29230 [Clostridium gelidum]
MKKRVSEIITQDEIEKWRLGDIVTIDANTGAGKSYFVKNVLYEYAKSKGQRILMLVHRKNCKYQFLDELETNNKTDIIDLRTYQSIENKELRKSNCDLSQYQYIVSDEFHYFMSDSSFNTITDISLNKILEASNSTRIFMSATGDVVKRYIKGHKKLEVREYEIPKDYSIIENLSFFNNDSSIEVLLKEMLETTTDKAIVFINSVEKCYQLHKKFEQYSVFNCSTSNEMYKHVDSEKIGNILKNEKFEERILFTTVCMDAGVNIKDKELKRIICDVKDIGVMKQCVGRKRAVHDEDRMNVYIKNINNNSLGGFMTKYKKNVAMAGYFRKHTIKEFIERYPRKLDYSKMIYDVAVDDENKCTKKINELMYFKYKTDIVLFQSIVNKKGNNGYQKYIAELFKQEEYDIIERKWEEDGLLSYLEKSVGNIMLGLKDRKELIQNINVKFDGHLLKGMQTINHALEERNIPYRIVELSISRMIKGKQKRYRSAWRIDRLIAS